MELSVVVVNWNSGEYLERLLASLAPLGDDVSILVVDNASSDSSLDCLEDYPRIELVRWEINHGFATAANEGIRRCATPYVLLLNPDITVYPEAVRFLCQKLREHPKAGLAVGYLEDEYGRLQKKFQLRPFPTVRSVIADAIFLDDLWECLKGDRGSESREGAFDDRTKKCHETTAQPAAAFWMMRKRAWEDLSGLDESFRPAWFEDVDFCLRLQERGWKTLLCSEVVGKHRGGVSLLHLSRTKFFRIFYGNLIRYWRKHHPVTLPLIWLPVKLGVLLRTIGRL